MAVFSFSFFHDYPLIAAHPWRSCHGCPCRHDMSVLPLNLTKLCLHVWHAEGLVKASFLKLYWPCRACSSIVIVLYMSELGTVSKLCIITIFTTLEFSSWRVFCGPSPVVKTIVSLLGVVHLIPFSSRLPHSLPRLLLWVLYSFLNCFEFLAIFIFSCVKSVLFTTLDWEEISPQVQICPWFVQIQHSFACLVLLPPSAAILSHWSVLTLSRLSIIDLIK